MNELFESLTLVGRLRANKEREPEKIALVYFDTEFTWRQVEQESRRVVEDFQRLGVTSGDRVAVQLQNSPQFVFCALAAWMLGAAIVPISPMYRAEEARHLIRDSGARVLVVQSASWGANGSRTTDGTDIEHVIVTGFREFASGDLGPFDTVVEPSFNDDGLESFSSGGGSNAWMEWQEPAEEQPAVLIYTSGTTGPPKGAVVSHANLAYAAENYSVHFGVAGSDEVLIAFAPFVHITGIVAHIGAWLSSGSTMVVAYRFDAAFILDLVARHRATWLVGAATAFTALVQEQKSSPVDLSSLRVVLSGGAPIPGALVTSVQENLGVPLLPGYGLSETAAVTSGVPRGADGRVDGRSGVVSVGLPIGSTRIRVVDEEGHDVASGEFGEVLISGPTVVAGYWRNDAESARAFRDGWLYTGDVGYLDSDGWLFLVDRSKDVIIASGYKVWPREVEEVLYSHPAVREVAVIGVPDEYRGETVKAVVSLNPGLSVDGGALIALCRDHLAAYKVPRYVEFVDDVPKNHNGKILHKHSPRAADS